MSTTRIATTLSSSSAWILRRATAANVGLIKVGDPLAPAGTRSPKCVPKIVAHVFLERAGLHDAVEHFVKIILDSELRSKHLECDDSVSGLGDDVGLALDEREVVAPLYLAKLAKFLLF